MQSAVSRAMSPSHKIKRLLISSLNGNGLWLLRGDAKDGQVVGGNIADLLISLHLFKDDSAVY